MSLVSKLKDARDAFHDAYSKGEGDWYGQLPDGLTGHMMSLGAALVRTEKLGEPYYHGLTNRSAFYGTHHAAQFVFNKYVATISGLYDDEDLTVKNALTLSKGILKTQLEECYRVLDAAVKQLEN